MQLTSVVDNPHSEVLKLISCSLFFYLRIVTILQRQLSPGLCLMLKNVSSYFSSKIDVHKSYFGSWFVSSAIQLALQCFKNQD